MTGNLTTQTSDVPNIIDNEDLFNVIILGGTTSPGQVTLSGHDRKHTWDVKSGPSLKGASVTLKETPPIEFTATFYLLRDDSQGIDDFAAWYDFQTVIDSSLAGATPKALDIYHPDLARNGISSVVKASVGGMAYDGKGGATVAIKFQEYLPPKKKGGSPTGSAKGGPDPNQDLKDELSKLTQQYQQTPWG